MELGPQVGAPEVDVGGFVPHLVAVVGGREDSDAYLTFDWQIIYFDMCDQATAILAFQKYFLYFILVDCETLPLLGNFIFLI